MNSFKKVAFVAGASAALALTGVFAASPASAEGAAAAAIWGKATFDPATEEFWVCDTKADGLGVGADIRWGGTTRHVGDANGSKAGCGYRDYSIAEGTEVLIRMTLDDKVMGDWVSVYA